MMGTQQTNQRWSASTWAVIALLLLVAVAAAAYYLRRETGGDDLAARTDALTASLKETEEIDRLADERVAHLPEARRAGARAMAAQAIKLNRQGFTCAEVVSASPLPGTDALIVTCLEALFENQRVRYRIDQRTGETTRL